MAIAHAITLEKFGEPITVAEAYTSVVGAHCHQEAKAATDETGKVITDENGETVLLKRWIVTAQIVTYASKRAKWNRAAPLNEKIISAEFDPNKENPIGVMYAAAKLEAPYADGVDV